MVTLFGISPPLNNLMFISMYRKLTSSYFTRHIMVWDPDFLNKTYLVMITLLLLLLLLLLLNRCQYHQH